MAVLYDPSDPSRAYYGTDGRAHLLLIGAGLALVLARWSPGRAARSTVNALGLAGAVTCLAFWVWVPDTAAWMYRGGYAVFGLCVAARHHVGGAAGSVRVAVVPLARASGVDRAHLLRVVPVALAGHRRGVAVTDRSRRRIAHRSCASD